MSPHATIRLAADAAIDEAKIPNDAHFPQPSFAMHFIREYFCSAICSA
jgi:hypothetical protein